MKRSRPTIALALGSSFLGFYAHAGFLHRMEKLGIHPTKVSGSSAGAIAGGLYSAGIRGDNLKRELCSLRFLSAFLDATFPFRFPSILFGKKAAALLHGRRIEARLAEITSAARIENLQEPEFGAGVSHLIEGRSELRTKGDLAKAIMASCAIPGLLKARTIEGKEFHDGGITDEAPFTQWIADPAIEEIVVHRVLHETRSDRIYSRPVVASLMAISEELFRTRVEHARQAGKKVTVVSTRHRHPGVFPLRTRHQFFSAGETTAEKLWSSPSQPNHV